MGPKYGRRTGPSGGKRTNQPVPTECAALPSRPPRRRLKPQRKGAKSASVDDIAALAEGAEAAAQAAAGGAGASGQDTGTVVMHPGDSGEALSSEPTTAATAETTSAPRRRNSRMNFGGAASTSAPAFAPAPPSGPQFANQSVRPNRQPYKQDALDGSSPAEAHQSAQPPLP